MYIHSEVLEIILVAGFNILNYDKTHLIKSLFEIRCFFNLNCSQYLLW